MTNFLEVISKILYPKIFEDNENINKELSLLKSKYQKSEKELYYEDKYPKSDIVYSGRNLPTINLNVNVDVRDFFTEKDSTVRKLVESLLLSNKKDDEKAVECLTWIINNIKYVSDNTKGYNEFWQFPYETIKYMTGDCEDMSILLANMIIISGVPSWKIRLSAGNVDDGHGNKGGHCFPVYYDETNDRWVLLDCCYYPNIFPIKDRKEYKDETYYLSTWFSWSKDYCWAKDVKDIPKYNSINFN